MRRTSYLKRASTRFLQGLRCKTPVEAVETGQRSLAQWAAILAEERDIEHEYLQQRLLRRRTPPRHRAFAS